MGCFWPLTASMTSEIKKNHAHVYPYRNLCKFSEINLSISNKIRNIGPITSKPINIYKQGIDAAWNNTHCFEACKNPVNPENSWKFHKFYYWISPNSFEDRQQLFLKSWRILFNHGHHLHSMPSKKNWKCLGRRQSSSGRNWNLGHILTALSAQFCHCSSVLCTFKHI